VEEEEYYHQAEMEAEQDAGERAKYEAECDARGEAEAQMVDEENIEN